MAEERRYYLRLQDDIFSSRRIKKLCRMENGYRLFVCYLKLQLMAMKHSGELRFTGLENSMEDELALDIEENTEIVQKTLSFLLKWELAEQINDKTIYLPWAEEMSGSEGSSAARMREYRQRKKQEAEQGRTETEQRSHNVQQSDSVRSDRVTHNYNKKQNQSNKQEEWQADYIYPDNKALFLVFCQEHDVDLDFAGTFFDRYTANGWRDGNGEPVRIWQNLLFEAWRKEKTEQSKTEARQEQRLPEPSYTTADLIEYPYGSGLYRPRQEVEGLGDG